MAEYTVSLERVLYQRGVYIIKATSPEQAVEAVNTLIAAGKLQTTMVDWDVPVYEDWSLRTTGDVD